MSNQPSAIPHNQSSAPTTSHENNGGADPMLLELVSLRVAQMHRCPIALEMHSDELRTQGETADRLDQLESWEESSLFDANERAALAFCENITMNPASPFPDHVIHEMRQRFTKAAIVSLTLAIMSVNDWNFA